MKYYALLIDDDTNYCESFKNEAQKFLIDVSCVHNLEDGINLINGNRRLSVVILDGHCFLEPEQSGKPKANFVYHAFHNLDEIEHLQHRIIPRCVNSEKTEDFNEELLGLVELFNKNADRDRLFMWIRKSIASLPTTKIIEKHPMLFDDTESIFTDDEEAELIELFAFAENCNHAEIPAHLAVIRRLLERVTDYASIQFLGKVSLSYNNHAGTSVKPVFDLLYSQRLIDKQIKKMAFNVYSSCSEFGNHLNRSSSYEIGSYGYLSVLYAFCEVTSVILKMGRH